VLAAESVPKVGALCGEDAYFASHSLSAFGIADGVGSWSTRGINAGLFSRGLLQHALKEMSRRAAALERVDLQDVLLQAVNRMIADETQGSTTVLLGQAHGDSVSVLNLGDSGIRVLRPMVQEPVFYGGQKSSVLRCIYRSSSILHRENLPWQVSSEDKSGSELAGCDLVTVQLKVDDLIIAGCDGLFDNISEAEIEELALEDLVGKASRGPATVRKLAKRLREVAEARSATPEGKRDDITVVVGLAQPWSASAAGGTIDNLEEDPACDSRELGPSAAAAKATSMGVVQGSQAPAHVPPSWPSACHHSQIPAVRVTAALHAGCLLAAPLSVPARLASTQVQCAVCEGMLCQFPLIMEPTVVVQARISALLGQGSFASAWQLTSLSHECGPSTAVLKVFVAPSSMLACLYGHEFVQEMAEQMSRERKVGERLATGPRHAGQAHIARLLSSLPVTPQEEGLPGMLVHEDAGTPLEGQVGADLSYSQRLAVVDGLCKGLAYLRLMDVVHGDISPGNVCIDSAGNARIIDFGNAVLFETARGRTMPCGQLEKIRSRYVRCRGFPASQRYAHPLPLVEVIEKIEKPAGINVYAEWYDPDLFVGNPAANPPEALRGMVMPGYSDMYGLGVLLWSMLTGEESPFDIEVACDRVRYTGWEAFYSWSEESQRTYLSRRLEENILPGLAADVSQADMQSIITWLLHALAEAPENRATALASGLGLG